MKKMRFYIALWTAKLSLFLMKILGQNATYLPGKVALKISKEFLHYLTPPPVVIAVTGTNGKTTVSNLLNSILTKCGYTVTNNSLGSNVQAGVITALLADSTLLGRPKKDIAVLEVDERSSLLIYPDLKPDYLICNNVMRDSLKRNAHTEFISFIINRALPSSTNLILNADDLICSSLGPDNQDRTYFGLDIYKPAVSAAPFSQDMVYCPKCGARLEAEYIRYNHIGRWFCPGCGLKSPEPDFLVTDIDVGANAFTVRHDGTEDHYRLINDNMVNIYNFCAAIALCSRLGLSYQQISGAFDKTEIVKTRYEQVIAGDLRITAQAAKGQNPIACARSFSYVASCPGQNKAVFLMLDDKTDNTGNSESVCWIYDCDYSYLADPSISQIIFAGPRCKDQYLRALIAGVPGEKIRQWPGFTGGEVLLDTNTCKDIYILHDVYLNSEASSLKDQLIQLGKERAGNDD